MGQPTTYNVALYLRLSRDDGMDRESSGIQNQREMLARYCRNDGFTNFTEYFDDGWSGMTAEKPSFQKMLSDIENGEINCVITMDFTPFKNPVNDMYVQDISKNIRSAMMTKKRQGKFIGDTAPYGYDKDPADKNHLIINEKYAPIVRRIYQMAKEGLGVKRIAQILSEEKIRRPGAVSGDTHAEFSNYVGN